MTGVKKKRIRRKPLPGESTKTRDSPERLLKRARIREEKRLMKKAEGLPARTAMIEECVRRVAGPSTRDAFREILTALVENNAIPVTLLATVPQRAISCDKSRFDQIYDACMFLAFADYRTSVTERAFGPLAPPDMKLWRAMFPKELGLSHVVVRARSFQEAFALSCDYACRLTLREQSRIPADMTVRVEFVNERSASRMLDIRHAVRDMTRKASNAKGRKYSPKDISGARVVAIGRKDGKGYSIFQYIERRDLDKLMGLKGVRRVSAVDVETFRPKESPPPYGEP